MVYTRQQNAKADANPSKTVSSKEQNDSFIQKVKEYSLYEKGEILYLFVLGLNESSTEDDMKKSLSFHVSSISLHCYSCCHSSVAPAVTWIVHDRCLKRQNQGKC